MLIEAGQICLFIYFLLTSFNYTGNKTKMKKYNITGQKDTQKNQKSGSTTPEWWSPLSKSNSQLKLFDCTLISAIGEIILTVERKGNCLNLIFQVVNSTNKPLLSAETCE